MVREISTDQKGETNANERERRKTSGQDGRTRISASLGTRIQTGATDSASGAGRSGGAFATGCGTGGWANRGAAGGAAGRGEPAVVRNAEAASQLDGGWGSQRPSGAAGIWAQGVAANAVATVGE